MAKKLTDRIVETAPWLDSAGTWVQQALAPLLGPRGPRPVQDILNGTWLGHPLHSSLVAVPIGAWTTTLVLDAAGMEQGADLSVLLGLVGALGSAASGAAQWEDTGGEARAIGFLHASLNISVTALYGASLLLRARGSRRAGIALSTLGYAVTGASAWLGGELSYSLGVGVSRTAFEDPRPEWTAVLDAGELAENTPRRVVAQDIPIMLLRQGGDIHAISATCTHLGGPLDEGKVEGDRVTCPWHGSVFCVTDGKVMHGPAVAPQPSYDVRERDGKIEVRPT